MYACENGIGRVDRMYFGHNDVVLGQPELRDDKSCALDVHDIQYCKSGDAFQDSDFSMQSLILMIKRAKNNEFYRSNEEIDCSPEEIDGCYWPRLALLGFIHKVYNIVCPEENRWFYDYDVRGIKRNDRYW